MRNPFAELPADLRAIQEVQVAEIDRKLRAFQAQRERWDSMRAKGERFSLGRAIVKLSTGQLDGPEREALEEVSRVAGVPFDRQRPVIPWGMLRDLTVAAGNAGGYLVGTDVAPAVDVIRPWSTVARAPGIQIVESKGPVEVPLVDTPPTGYALPTEGTAITESTPSIGTVALTPKNLAVYCEFSRQFALQANADRFVRQIMLSALGRFLDTQVLQGSGASGQLIGVCNWPGIAVQSGTSLAFGGLTTMRQTVTVADAPPEQLAWIATPIVAELMRNEMKVSGDYSPCWEDNGTMLGYPAYATTTMPAGTLLLGAWGQVVLGLFGPGFLLEIDPFSGFKTGVIGARMIVTADVAVMRIGTFMVASGVT